MAVPTEAERFAVIWQTVAALIVAAIVGVIGMVLAGAFIYFSQRLITDVRPQIINFFASIGAGAAGVFAAREVCDRLFKHYSQRAVFGLFALYAVASGLLEIFLIAAHWGQISIYAQDLTILLVSYSIFWKGEPTGFSN